MDELFPLGCPGDIETVLRRYASGELTPSQVVERVHTLVSNDDSNAWIYVLPLEVLRQYAREVEARVADMAALPLYGIPFAIKDNIDLAGVQTTAACPALRLHAVQDCGGGAEIDRCRGNSDWKDQSRSIRHWPEWYKVAVRRLPQCAEPGLYFRRFELRLGSGVGKRNGMLQSRNRYRWFRQSPCGVQ